MGRIVIARRPRPAGGVQRNWRAPEGSNRAIQSVRLARGLAAADRTAEAPSGLAGLSTDSCRMCDSRPIRARLLGSGSSILACAQPPQRRLRRPVGRSALAAIVALGATQLGACVRYDSMRGFYGRDSLVLQPEEGAESESNQALATAPDDIE